MGDAEHRSQAEWLRLAQIAGRIGVFDWNLATGQVRWSEELEALYGLAPQSAARTLEAWRRLLHPEDREATAAAFIHAATVGGDFEREFRIVWPNGAVHWIGARCTVYRHPDGHPDRMIGINMDITDRKRTELALRSSEQALRMSEARFRAAIAASPAVMWQQDRQLRYTWIYNPASPFTAAMVLGKTDHDLLPPEDADALARIKLDVIAKGTSAQEAVRTTLGGVARYYDLRVEPMHDEHGAVSGIVCASWEITDRIRLERELRVANAMATGIVDVSADAIISIDSDQRITMFNEGAEKLFGWTKAETIGAPLDILLPERFRLVHRRHVERFAAGTEVARRMGERGAAIFGRRKDGEEFPADASISRLQVDETRILTVALRDITEQKRGESEQRFLAEIGAMFAASLDFETTLTNVARITVREFADFCIVEVANDDGQIRRLRVVCRDPSQEWICDLLERVPLDRTRPHLVHSALRTGRTSLVKHVTPEVIAGLAQSEQHLHALRALDPQSVIAVPLILQGRIMGALALISTTPSRRYGDADVRLAEELAHRAAMTIDNARLYRAAQQATRIRDEVLGIVAHDLRNPLTSIALVADGICKHDDGIVRDAAARIERAVTRMGRLIEDLLHVTRMEVGKLAIAPGPVPAREVIEAAASEQESLAAAAGLELGLEAAQDLPEVWADYDRLLQIFENLIGNAIKFTPRGGRITLGATAREADVLFRVSDTGAGIPEEDQQHLFERFWQARKATGCGAGLGLPIVKGLVEAHGGHVWVTSAPGRGSTFSFTIPRALRSGRTGEPPTDT